ncbi:MAG: glycogen synthase GlgA [Defluviitaleaceae bacterium]|nr:glycogen synthase GlgA [Defluviitaleaceae bacterium]
MSDALKVLIVAAEMKPFCKSGGLGDVIGSLPAALRQSGVDARVVIPKYRTIPGSLLAGLSYVDSLTIHLSWRTQSASVLAVQSDGIPVYLIENDYYFGRDLYYGSGDDFERFAFFSMAAVELMGRIDFKADVVHFHDWQTGLGCVYLRDIYRQFSFFSKMKSLFTIHNLNYQGVFNRNILWHVGLNDGYYTNGELEFYGNISFLKAGIVCSDAVSTVSETYAKEIQTPSFGYGMDGLLWRRGAIDGRLYGILNGIDTAAENPVKDKRIYVNYSTRSINKKKENKYKLQEALGLPQGDIPMFAVVSRLVDQKGFDIISLAMDELLSKDIQFVVLGTGEGRYENMFRHYAWRYPHKMNASILFDDVLAQRIYAASDMFIMPSIYEPCGLGQLYAMRYGSIPIARKTGGLADTVTAFDPETGCGNGFLFEDFVASGLMWAVNQALHFYHTDKWQQIIKNAMKSTFSWEKSAESYIELYEQLKSE